MSDDLNVVWSGEVRWERHRDVVRGVTGWADDELYSAWIRQTRVIRGREADPVTGRVRAPFDPAAPRGVCVGQVRELAEAIANAYRAVNIPAPADPHFARTFLSAFGGVSRSGQQMLPCESGPEPTPPPRHEDFDTPEERSGAIARHRTQEALRRTAFMNRSWLPIFRRVLYRGAVNERVEALPGETLDAETLEASRTASIANMFRSFIDWEGRFHPQGLSLAADEWITANASWDARAHGGPLRRAAAEAWADASPAAVSAPFNGATFFVAHECTQRSGDCQRWAAHIIPSPAMEWDLWCAIADTLEARSAQDVMTDAWRHIARRNVEVLRANNLATTEVNDLIGFAEREAEVIQRENGLRDTGNVLNMLSNAAMAAGPYGAVVGAILKGIALIFEALPVAVGHEVDVWNRRQPSFSRPYLSIEDTAAPTYRVTLPPRFDRAPRAKLTIAMPPADSASMRVRVGYGVWRPYGWQGELPLGSYAVEIEQPGRVSAQLTVHLREAGAEKRIELRPLPRALTEAERERQRRALADAAQTEAEKRRKPSKRKPTVADAAPGKDTPREETPTPATDTPREEAAPPPAATGTIVVNAPADAPTGTRVRVLSEDGARELAPWSTPPLSLAVPVGSYRVEWSAPGADAPSAVTAAVVAASRTLINLRIAVMAQASVWRRRIKTAAVVGAGAAAVAVATVAWRGRDRAAT